MLSEKAMEAVARALCVYDDVDPDAVYYDRTGQNRPNYSLVLGEAEAAIKAYLTATTEEGYVIEQGWRPIETAPTHTDVLVSNTDDYHCLLAQKTHLAETFLNEREQEESEISEDDLWEITWFDMVTAERLEGEIAPTHWRPIPEPPAMISKAEQGEG